MIEDVLNQPINGQFGEFLYENLVLEPPKNFANVFILTAWTTYSGLHQLSQAFEKFSSLGGRIEAVTGISLGGTSIEGLKLLNELTDSLFIFHNKSSIFHPKIYIFQKKDEAKILVGSNNLTRGGMFSNYEVARIMTLNLQDNKDKILYSKFKNIFDFYSTPSGVCRKYNDALLASLVRDKLVPSERNKSFLKTHSDGSIAAAKSKIFDSISYPINPLFLKRNKTVKYKVDKIEQEDITTLKFYMDLTKLQGNIPGEARIPQMARDMANDFWGWPGEYTRMSRNQGKGVRYYVEWKTKWKIIDTSNDRSVFDNVRLYLLESNKDFRFYSAALVNLGADKFDIVEITRSTNDDYAFLCRLAKQGTEIHNQWKKYLTHNVKNSERKFGYVYGS
jgi:HKD family nuclease